MSVAKTELLEALIERSKALDAGHAIFTADRLVIVLIGLAKDGAGDLACEELQAAIALLEEKGLVTRAAREALLTPPKRTEMSLFLDDLYMKKKLRTVTEQAEAAGRTVIDTVSLLTEILKDPCDAIATLLKTPPTEGPGQTASPKEAATDGSASSDKTAEEPAQEPVQEDTLLTAAELFDIFDTPDEQPSERERMENLIGNVKRIRTDLKRVVFGQDNAINVFATGYFRSEMMALLDKKRSRPRATFLFAGPPGVGKTFLAEKAAESLGLPFMRFDMSEYADKEANIEFCGSDKVYKNAKSGNVTSFVAENPHCVLLFDEIEKAHLCVIHLFLQILDAGRLRDNFTDEEVSFADAIIILTTNAGRQLYEESESGDLSATSRKVVVKALQKDVNPVTGAPYFPGAICSRFASGNVVMFNHMGAHNLRDIAKREILRSVEGFEREIGMAMEVDERVYAALLFSEGSAADARTIRGRAEAFFNDEIYELMRLLASDKVKTGIGAVETVKIGVDLSRARPEITELFDLEEETSVLVFAPPATVALCQSKLPDFVIHGTQCAIEAMDAVKDRNVDFVLLDVCCGIDETCRDRLNVEDQESPARDFYKFLREQRKGLPIYLLEREEAPLSEEERESFVRSGVRGVMTVTEGEDDFASRFTVIAADLHQQENMIKLARENKLVTFETSQRVSEDGKIAEITLFDFEMSVALESQDAKNVLAAASRPTVRFDDVIGARDAKKELAYFVEYLKNPKKYLGTGVKAPKGVLLYGPPGTGKTLLAKAMACESGVTFLAAEGNQFLKKFVGEGSDRVHELFKTARKYAPSILFIDEIDAIAKERRGGMNAGASGEETLTAFLTEMDGFVNDPSRPVFVLAATNFEVEPGHEKSLDPALMRRFDRRVYLELPNREDRIRFLRERIARNAALAISEGQIENLAMRATGMSLAELDSVVELALRSAIREGSTTVTDGILEEAFETFNSGEAKKWDISQLERVARHEAGHAFLCYESGETPSYLTIVARANHGGYMQHADWEGKAIYTKNELLSRIRTSLGGRAAEIVYYGEEEGISSGASGDLITATAVAQQIVCAYGMDQAFGLGVIRDPEGESAAEVRAAVNRILGEQMAEAVRLIAENRDKVDRLVEALMTQNHMNGAEIEAAIRGQD